MSVVSEIGHCALIVLACMRASRTNLAKYLPEKQCLSRKF